MTAIDRRPAIALVLRSVPADTESPRSLREICVSAGFGGAAADESAAAVVAMLGVFGVLNAVTVQGDLLVKAETPTAHLFLASLAEYVSSGQVLLDNWGRSGTVDPPYHDRDVLTGSQFLYLIEQRRTRLDPSAAPLRQVRVSKVVIKARRPGGAAGYLVIYDAAARQYQLAGGGHRRADGDMHDVAIRELQEELPGFVFDATYDRLVRLGAAGVPELSRTTGAYTRYELSLFHLVSTRTNLDLPPGARWVPESAIVAGAFAGQSLNNAGLSEILSAVPDGLGGLEPSIRPGQENRLVALSRSRPLEFWGFVVGVVGVLLSVAFYFLQG